MRKAIILLNTLKFLSPLNLRLKTIRPIPNYNNLALPISQSLLHFRFFSSNSKHDPCIQSSNHPLDDASFDETEDGRSDQVKDVINKELKMKMERYYKGDDNALTDIFGTIVMRKLAGKHGQESDDEILEEFQPDDLLDDASDDEVDSDFDDTDFDDTDFDDTDLEDQGR